MRKYLMFLIPLLFLSCTSNEFNFTTDVDAEVIGTTNRYIGLKYDLYEKTVFQDVYIATYAEFAYFSKMKIIPLTVTVKGHDRDGGDYINIILKYNGNVFGGEKSQRYNDLSIQDFMSQDINIPNFVWYKHNDEDYDGISPQELRAKLAETGEEAPETKVTITVEEEKETGADL